MIISKLDFLTFMALIFLPGFVHPFPGINGNREPTPDFRRCCTAASSSGPASVVISEIMADPLPVVALPDAEWAELLNYSNLPVSLKNWKLIAGTSGKVLPDSVILPGEYVIVCSSKMSQEMKKFGKVVVVNTFPALRNSGNSLFLISDLDLTVDRVDYSDSWYGSSVKKNGGWSLEKIDPERSCGQSANWTASVHPNGGTPGQVNSVNAENSDTKKPSILSVKVTPPNHIEIDFSEPMDTLRLKENKNYRLSGGWGNPDQVTFSFEKHVLLTWNRAFTRNAPYDLTFENLSDQCGNLLDENQVEVAWISIEKGDVVINEILFNPWPKGSDFVEITNVSSKKIESRRLLLATRDDKGQLKSLISLEGTGTVLEQGDYMAVTADTEAVFSGYQTLCRPCIRQLPSMPPYNNDKGCAVLLGDSLQILDEFTYSEKMHHPLLHTVEGVSLERINPGVSGHSPNNWHSASSECGFATPGYQNSQYQAEPLKKTEIIFEQTAFSPNGDGFNDQLRIRYKTMLPGWMATCRIFDRSGRLLFKLLDNSMLGTSGIIEWAGEDETGDKLPCGPYILLMELFDLNGNYERYKKAVVLTDKGTQ